MAAFYRQENLLESSFPTCLCYVYLSYPPLFYFLLFYLLPIPLNISSIISKHHSYNSLHVYWVCYTPLILNNIFQWDIPSFYFTHPLHSTLHYSYYAVLRSSQLYSVLNPCGWIVPHNLQCKALFVLWLLAVLTFLLVSVQIQENINLFTQARNNIFTILNEYVLDYSFPFHCS